MRAHGSCRLITRQSSGFPDLRARLLLAACCLLGALAGHLEAAPVRIMPLGDSITYAVGDETNSGGYRGPLYAMLTSAGYSVDFVGTLSSGAIPDPNHEGHSGWRADQIRDYITGWLTVNPPNIVLLHIGTNDISQGEQVDGITTEIGQILDDIDAYEIAHDITVTVVLARIINRNDSLSGLTSALNVSIASMAAARIAAGDKLVVVDQESALSYPGDLADIVHPNAGGYQKMAAVWFDALVPLLRNKGELVSETIPTTMLPGNAYDCSVTMLNAGHDPWLCSPTGTRLAVAQSGGPAAHELIPDPYYEIYVDPCQIDVGESCTFHFTVSVPADAPLGPYELSWQMRDDIEWFDSNGHNAVFRKALAVRLHLPYRGDFDDDADVDQEDFGHFQICLSGEGVVPDDPSCADANFDGDYDVDQQDLAVFRRCYSGVGAPPADPTCVK
jgi:lysophospholipase L1-like esterase